MSEADVKELRDLYSHDTAEWKPIRDAGTEDMRYAAGDPWDPRDRGAREKALRPCLNADELSQYVNQVVNEVRANKRAVRFTPIGNGANDKSAQFYADKMREIEYRSRAQIGYTTAFENCVQRSFGFVRVNTRYAHARSAYQDLWIDAVHNPNLITPDSLAQMPDLSDMRHCWVREKWGKDEFNRSYDKFRVGPYDSATAKLAGDWMSDTHVFVGEYWCIKHKPRTLLLVQVPGASELVGVFEDELKKAPLPEGAQVVKTRKVEDPYVVQKLTNGLDILEETDWPGKYIPIVGCFGKIVYLAETGSEKRHILSMIRLARDPQMMLAYIASAQAETIGQLTKFPYFAYKGQLDPTNLNRIAASLHEPVAVVEVNATIEGLPPGNGPLPFPQRNPWVLDLQQLELGKESFRRSIQAGMGQTPLPTAAQRRNEKSGVALKHIDELGQRGSFHFVDHYLDMITQVGIVCEDLMDKVYDTPRDVGIRHDDDTAEIVRINEPDAVQTKGDHLVTVSTGPSYDSEREAANEFAGDLLESQLLQLLGPEKAPKVIAKAVKLKNLGPIGDQIAEIIAPEPPKEGEPPTVEQLQQALEAAGQQNQQLQQQLQQAAMAIQTDQAKQQATIQTAQMREQAETQREAAKIQAENARTSEKVSADERQAALDNLVKLAIAEMNAQNAMASQHAEMARDQLGFQHEHAEGERERTVGAQEAERARQFQGQQADTDRTVAMQQAEADRQAQASQPEV